MFLSLDDIRMEVVAWVADRCTSSMCSALLGPGSCHLALVAVKVELVYLLLHQNAVEHFVKLGS